MNTAITVKDVLVVLSIIGAIIAVIGVGAFLLWCLGQGWNH